MMDTMNRKTLETFRDGILCGAEAIREQASRVSFRTPWTYRRPIRESLVSRPWLVGLVVFSSVLAALSAYFYLRKRKQVADHFTMAPDLETESWDGVEDGVGKVPAPARKFANRPRV